MPLLSSSAYSTKPTPPSLLQTFLRFSWKAIFLLLLMPWYSFYLICLWEWKAKVMLQIDDSIQEQGTAQYFKMG